MARYITSRVWGGMSRYLLTEHLMEATWDPTYRTSCDMYAYARSYGVVGCKHPGLDISMPHGSRITAARAGKIVTIRNPGISGRIAVMVEDTLGERQEYVHLSSSSVSVGQSVTVGQQLGFSGTLNSPHLHFEHRIKASTPSGWAFKHPEAVLTGATAPAPTVAPASSGTTSTINLNMINVDFRQIGDVNVSVYEHEFRRLGSPLLASAVALRNAAVPMSALMLAQMFMENKYSTVGFIIKPADNNPVAMRPWEHDPRRTTAKPVIDWSTRAQVGTMVLPPHYAGAIRAGDGTHMARFNSLADAAAEYKYRLQAGSPYKGGIYNPARTLQQMLNIYAPAGDIHPVTGVANEHSGYYSSVVTMLNNYAKLQGTIVVSAQGQAGPINPAGQHKFVLSMGHRNTGGGGAAEAKWTPGATRALRDAIKAHGGQAVILQEVDGLDADPNWFPGDHSAGAKRCVTFLQPKYGPFKAYISMHFNGGGGRGAFAIHPESHDGSDTKSMNALSVNFARRFAARVKATSTVPLLGWMKDGPGVMSERESGVGSQGYRLGELANTMGFDRNKVVRTILEAGGGDNAADRVFLYDSQWVRHIYSEAVVRALKDIFGDFTTALTGPAKFTPGQAVQFVTPHFLHDAPRNDSGRTVNISAGNRATIVSGPHYAPDAVPWWNVRVENVDTGWVKQAVLAAAAATTPARTTTPAAPTSITYPQVASKIWKDEWRPITRWFNPSESEPGVTIGMRAGTAVHALLAGTITSIIHHASRGTYSVTLSNTVVSYNYGKNSLFTYHGMHTVSVPVGSSVVTNQQIGTSGDVMDFSFRRPTVNGQPGAFDDPWYRMRLVRRTATSIVWGGVARLVWHEWDEEAIWEFTYGSTCAGYASNQKFGIVGCKHGGMDVLMPVGTPLYAYDAGYIDSSGTASNGQSFIGLRLNNGHRIAINHLQNVIPLGTTVTAGQKIAEIGPHGPTGYKEHAHIDYRIPDASLASGWRIVDPERITTARYIPPRITIKQEHETRITAIVTADPTIQRDMGPEGFLHIPFDGTLTAQETSLGRDFTLSVQHPVSYVDGPFVGSWAATAEEATTNHITNPLAAFDTSGIIPLNATLTRVSDPVGTWFRAEATSTASHNLQGATPNGSGNRPAAAAGERWTMSALVRSGIARGVYARVGFYDVAGALLQMFNGTISNTDAVGQRRTVTGTAPTGTAYVLPMVQMTGTGTVGDWFEATELQLEKKAFGSSFTPRLERGTKNVLANPSAEFDLTNILRRGVGTTIDRVYARPQEDGEWAVSSTHDGSVDFQGIRYLTYEGLGWTGTSRTIIGSVVASSTDTTPDAFLRVFYTDNTSVNGPAVAFTGISGEPTRFTVPAMTTDATKTVRRIEIIIRRSGTGVVWNLVTDAAMVEVGTAVSAYEQGQEVAVGLPLPGYAWTGTPHASSSTRQPGLIKAERGDLNFHGPRGTVAVRFQTTRIPESPASGVTSIWGIGVHNVANRNKLSLEYKRSTKKLIVHVGNGTNLWTAEYTITVAVPEWITVGVDWENGQPVRVRYEDQAWAASNPTTWQSQQFWGGPLYIGSNESGENPLGGPIDALIHFDRRLTDEQWNTIRTTQYWWPSMFMTGLQQNPHEPLPGAPLEDIQRAPYLPPAPPQIILGAEPFIKEGRQYSVAVSLFHGTITGQITRPMRLSYEGGVRIAHSDDAAIKRTIELEVNDIVDLHKDRGYEAYSDTIIPVMKVTSETGESRVEQLGVFVLEPFMGTDDFTHTTTTMRGRDVTWLLSRAPILNGWTAPGNTDYGEVVRTGLLRLGFPPSQVAIGNTGKKTPPEGVPYFPGTTWLQAYNDLLRRARWYVLSANRRGVLHSSAYLASLGSVSPVIHYDTRRQHMITSEVSHDPGHERFGNIAIARKLPATKNDPAFYWASVNSNPNSHTSTVRRGPIMIEPIIEGNFTSQAECKAAADAALSQGQSYFHRMSITTGVEMTAEANQIVAIDIERAGNTIATGRWWRQSWETTFDGVSALTTHHVNRVEVYE